jgi:hypothetical protein
MFTSGRWRTCECDHLNWPRNPRRTIIDSSLRGAQFRLQPSRVTAAELLCIASALRECAHLPRAAQRVRAMTDLTHRVSLMRSRRSSPPIVELPASARTAPCETQLGRFEVRGSNQVITTVQSPQATASAGQGSPALIVNSQLNSAGATAAPAPQDSW